MVIAKFASTTSTARRKINFKRWFLRASRISHRLQIKFNDRVRGRWIFLFAIACAVTLGRFWWLGLEIESGSWESFRQLCIRGFPLGLIFLWPFAQQMADSPVRGLSAKAESTLLMGLKFLAMVVAMISLGAAAIAGLLALIWATSGELPTAATLGIFGAKVFGVGLGLLLFTALIHFGSNLLSNFIRPQTIDSLYLAWAGSAAFAIALPAVRQTWIGAISEAQASSRANLAVWIVMFGVVFAIWQTLRAAPLNKTQSKADGLATALVLSLLAGLYWAIGEAFIPAVMGGLAWLGVWLVDSDRKKRF